MSHLLAAVSRWLTLAGVKVVWDEAKNVANQKKHRAIGPIRRGIILIVWTEREDDEVRIISARWAKPPERPLYREYSGREND